MKKDLVQKRFVLVTAAVSVLALFSSCSPKQKGYSASLNTKQGNEKGAPPAQGQTAASSEQEVRTQDDEFLDWIAKVESGEIEQEPPRNQEVAEQSQVTVPEGDVLEIKDKLFLTQINDIYFNLESYKDKTIIVEGMFTYLASYLDDSQFPAVYRLGPGCCGNDGWGGFMLDWNGTYPELNDWIRVVGKPVIKEYKGYQDLYLQVASLEVKEERGMEFVQN